jgi:uncharacterized coiled-coil protein SlyX
MQEKLGGAQASTTSDQADRVALLTGGIVTLQRSSGDLAGQLPALQADVARLYEAQQPFAAEVAQHDQQLAELQAEQKAAVDPLNARLTDLQTRVRVANERLSALVGQMTPLTASLGGKVARARPEAPALAGAYGEVDRLDRELSGVTNQGDLLKARLAAVDTGALRKFYLLAGIVVAVIVVVITLLFIR